MNNESLIESEARRVQTEYERREREIDADTYAPWQPGEMFMIFERERVAATMLKAIGRFPNAGDRCLELGYGKLGWLGRLVSWGLLDSDLHGIELDAKRAAIAKRALPNANLVVGNAVHLPWENDYFRIVIASTVFSSILDKDVRVLIAKEMDRVLMPGGVVIWYDAKVDNPRNRQIKSLSRSEIEALFPNYNRYTRSVTLAPSVSRTVAKFSWTLASVLGAIPFLRTHLLGTLVKQ